MLPRFGGANHANGQNDRSRYREVGIPGARLVSVSGADPLNLAGILTPGPKLAALAGNRVLYRDGIRIAFLEGNSTRFLEPVEPEIENLAR